MIRFIITLPFILVLFYIIFKFIWAEIKHRKHMRSISDFSDFHKKLLEWSNTITDLKVRDEYLVFCLELLDFKSGTKNMTNFKEKEQLELVIQKFGKYIPELQQKSRDEQIEKILS